MGSRVVVVGVAGRGGLRWWRGTWVVVVRCVLLAETAIGPVFSPVDVENTTVLYFVFVFVFVFPGDNAE